VLLDDVALEDSYVRAGVRLIPGGPEQLAGDVEANNSRFRPRCGQVDEQLARTAALVDDRARPDVRADILYLHGHASVHARRVDTEIAAAR